MRSEPALTRDARERALVPLVWTVVVLAMGAWGALLVAAARWLL